MIRIGVLGLGKIASRIIEGILEARGVNLYAVCSHSKEKALSFKEKYQAQIAYTCYEDFYKDPNIDLIYIATANNFHFQNICDALNHNKNVICEKPMVTSFKDLDFIFNLAKSKNCLLLEANKTIYNNLFYKIKNIISNDMIGDIQEIYASYCFKMQDINNSWVFSKEAGCIRDIGVYPIVFCNKLAGSRMKELKGQVYKNSGYECDFGGLASLVYENGLRAIIETSWLYDTKNKGYALIRGSRGMIYVDAFWKNNEFLLINDQVKKYQLEKVSDFKGEIEAAIGMLENKKESLKNNYRDSYEILRIVNGLLDIS